MLRVTQTPQFGSLHATCRRGEPIRVNVLNDGSSSYFLNDQKRGDAFDFVNGTKSMHPAPQDQNGVLAGLAKYFETTTIAFPNEHAELRDRLRGIPTKTTPPAAHNTIENRFNADQGEAHIVMPRLDQ